MVMEFPVEQQLYRQATIRRVEEKVGVLNGKQHMVIPPNRDNQDAATEQVQSSLGTTTTPTTKFKPAMEYFRSKPTGNLILNSKCSFCEYKFHCYPNVQLKPKAKSTAKVPQLQYYVEYHDV